jgi:signal transduction histidine kinase
MPSLLVYVVALVVYFVSFWGVGAFRPTPSAFVETLAGSFGDMVVLFLHFVAVTAGVQFYLQYAKLRKTLKELDESKAQLQDAYDHLAEVTALEERQRIAKDIHDTAGHSITTVIMQTEAAKMVLETDPADAKVRIVAANLQAKHALEELRESVHLLSGSNGKGSLKAELEEIIHQTTDGTDIKIRSEIQDVIVSSKKYRFLCNTLKEGIANGLRHGGATAFWFELKEEDGNIRFLLSDNGKGTPEGIVPGFGLTTMQERAKSLGGEVGFDAEEGEGFELRLSLPTDAEV